MNFLDKFFHYKEKGGSLKNEIIGGLMTFIAMCYILPLNASILSSMGMSRAGVFAMTALVSFLVTMIMALDAKYPIVLSAGMGLNAFIAYTLSEALFPNWQQKMILLTFAGLIFFVFSLTPVRKLIIESIPKDLKCVISAALGAFIMFVGLKGTGVIAANSSTLVAMGNLLDPAVIVGLLSIGLGIGLTFNHHKMVSTLAIPISILFAAILGLVVSIILKENNLLISTEAGWVYNFGEGNPVTGTASFLPIAPWYDSSLRFGLDLGEMKKVFMFGLLTDEYAGANFRDDLLHVISTPATYVAVFSLIFVNLFDTTATLIAIGDKTGLIDENGEMKNYRKAVLADATGALICAPLGTSTVTSFAESNVGVSMGAKTGLAAAVSALMFFLSVFIYPIFSIFTAGSVTASALVVVGITIVIGALKGINYKDPINVFTAIIGVAFAVLTYSISNGIGVALIMYCIMLLFAKRGKEIPPVIAVVASLFLVSFALNAVMQLL